jgi:hypothetical protein
LVPLYRNYIHDKSLKEMDKGVDYMSFTVKPFEFDYRNKISYLKYNEEYRIGSGFDLKNN